MLCLNDSPQTLRKTFSADLNILAAEKKVMSEFEESDLSARVDIIVGLWSKYLAAATDPSSAADNCNSVLMGMKLCERIYAEQSTEIKARINESAAQLFYAAASRQLDLDPLDTRTKSRLCAMALSHIEANCIFDDSALIDDFSMNISHFLAIPLELAKIIGLRRLMNKTLLDAAIQLLAKDKPEFISTTTLLYNPHNSANPLDVAYLTEAAVLWKDNAKKKLKQLLPGQKLMIPVQSSPIDLEAQRVMDGHFSAILAVKTTEGHRFYIFDSNSSPDTKDNKSQLIRYLIEEGEKNRVFFLRQPFQYHNDCGLHTFNFLNYASPPPQGPLTRPASLRSCLKTIWPPWTSASIPSKPWAGTPVLSFVCVLCWIVLKTAISPVCNIGRI
ncbi:hypothetical protein ABK905_23385 [Acerihabitans sp. KWT182]|uniref:Ubiquitin-like protease family profile domain-containing protein n=1 Tax=Acerihabitans sp. KWT182 TaxID=3157919 RepID=A0AAU7Q8H0_9GAMM